MDATHLGVKRPEHVVVLAEDALDVGQTGTELLGRLQAMRALVWQAARYPVPFQAAGALTKAFCADTAWEVCTRAMALLGDHGYLHGSGVEKAARDARLTQIYEGTNQINRLAVFEGQQGAELAGEASEATP